MKVRNVTPFGGIRTKCRRIHSRRSLKLENLEKRQLLAGDVVANLFGSSLVIEGDDAANDIAITAGSSPGELVISGRNTTINGSRNPAIFESVEDLTVRTNDGADRIDAHHLSGLRVTSISGGRGDDSLSVRHSSFGDSSFSSRLDVDGNEGDDHISLIGTTVDANRAFVTVTGDRNHNATVEGGNDTIKVTETTITGDENSRFVMSRFIIVGDDNFRSTVQGGNDLIDVTNTKIIAGGSQEEFNGSGLSFLSITGDMNYESDLIGGNDTIRVTGTEISRIVTGDRRIMNNSALYVAGDINKAFGRDSTIIGGNDNISIVNTLVEVDSSGSTATASAVSQLQIVGEYNQGGSVANAVIDGGNDTIGLSNVEVSSRGAGSRGMGDSMVLVYGSHSSSSSSLGYSTVINGDNDKIDVANSRLTAGGGTGRSSSLMFIYGEFVSGNAIINGGDDDVSLRNLSLRADNFAALRIATGVGDDALTVVNSEADRIFANMGGGDDKVLFSGNSFTTAEIDGGSGTDELNAHNNLGLLSYLSFEWDNVN